MRRAACFSILALTLTLLGCGSDAVSFDVRVIDADGENPVTGTDISTLSLQVQQQTFPLIEDSFEVLDGSFDASIVLGSFVAPTTIRAELIGLTTRLFSASPRFVPNQVTPTIRLIVAEPSTCVSASRPSLMTPRTRAGSTRVAHFTVLVGGSAEDPQIELVDLVSLESNVLTGTEGVSALGPTQVADTSSGSLLAVPEAPAQPFILATTDPFSRITPVSLHAGADTGTVVNFNETEAWVVGGLVGDVPQTSISIIGGDTVAPGLLEARSRPIVVPIGGRLVVVGGDEAGTAEVLDDGVFTMLESFADGVRRNPIAVTDGQSFLVMGGTDEGDVLRQDTVLFTGCEDACVTAPGPAWTNARIGAATFSGSGFVVGGEGSQLVERVTFSPGSASISTANELQTPRANAAIDVLQSGILVVVGGETAEGIRGDAEYCYPAELGAL